MFQNKNFTNQIFYERNKEKYLLFLTQKSYQKITTMKLKTTADNLEYNKLSNIFYARENVIIEDKLAKIKINR